MSKTQLSPILLGQHVYHRAVYEHGERLKVVGITEDKIWLEGDFSGGTHGVCQRDWLPIAGTSRVYNHALKARLRQEAIAILALDTPSPGNQGEISRAATDMARAVLALTTAVPLNPEW